MRNIKKWRHVATFEKGELEKFILEMESDFAFLARQEHIVLDGKETD